MKAWLITWEWDNESAAVADKIIGILNSRWASNKVKMIVEFAYIKSSYNLTETSNCAKRPSNNPYRAKTDFNGQIFCGHNPYILARLVENLKIETNSKTQIETITWTELPIYKPNEETVGKIVRDKIEKEYIRKIIGPLSDRVIWDREKGDYSDWWKSKL